MIARKALRYAEIPADLTRAERGLLCGFVRREFRFTTADSVERWAILTEIFTEFSQANSHPRIVGISKLEVPTSWKPKSFMESANREFRLWIQNLQMEGHQLAFKNQHTEKSKNLKRSIKDAFTFCHSNDVNVNEPEAEGITSKGVNRVNRLPAFEFKFLKSAKFFIISSAFEGLNDSTIIQSASRVSRKL